MDPLIGGLITGGANLAGSMFSSSTSASNTAAQIAAQQGMLNQTEQYNAAQAEIQRQYQTQMSNTAYQRSVADMTKAGLNPMMMFGSGGAASTPGGGSASVGTPTPPVSQAKGAFSGLGDAASAAVNTAVAAKTLDKMQEEIANYKVLQGKGIAETGATQALTAQRKQETTTEEYRSDVTRLLAQLERFKIPGAAASARQVEKGIGELPDSVVGFTEKAKYLGGTFNDLVAPWISSAMKVQALRQAGRPRSREVNEQGWRDPESGTWSRQSYERSQ